MAPVFLSLACVLMVILPQARFCTPPRVDEGTAAHIFQILMVLQLPMALAYVRTRGDRKFAALLPTLALQAAAWGVAATAARLLT